MASGLIGKAARIGLDAKQLQGGSRETDQAKPGGTEGPDVV
jgi:hypothetical protein